MVSPELLTGLGAALSLFLCSAGACAASAPAGVYAMRGSVHGLKAFMPIVISGVLAIYGVIVAIALSNRLGKETTSEMSGYRNFASGLSVGLTCLASGLGMAKFLEDFMASFVVHFTESTPDGTGEGQPLLGNLPPVKFPAPSFELFCVYVFLEAIGLYGLIVALILVWE